MTREIPLGKGHVALVDDADYEYVMNAGPWHTVSSGHLLYAVHTTFDAPNTFGAVYMHRLLMPAHNSVDHINRNSLDNRRSNLRPATSAQNSQNRRKRSDSRWPYKGIRRVDKRTPWIAAITVRGATKYLGAYATPEEAARAYDAAARQHHGEFAAVNFPEEIHS